MGMKRPSIDRSQRVLSIHNLNVAIIPSTGCILGFESANSGQFQARATGDFAALSTQHPHPICQVKLCSGQVSTFLGKNFSEGALHIVTFANSEVLE